MQCFPQSGTMEMSDQNPLPWEVWHARFDFSEGSGYKFRPVVILASSPKGIIAAMVTSATNKLDLEHDYRLKDWGAAGLDKPSIVRLSRIAEVPEGYLGTAGRIGRLSDMDIDGIDGALAGMVG